MTGLLGSLPQGRRAIGFGRALAAILASAMVAAALICLIVVLYAALGPRMFVAGAAMSAPLALTVAVIGLGRYRAGRSRAVARARLLESLVEANRLFCLRPNEGAIRQHLADAITNLTGCGAAVSGADGRLAYRAGRASQWRGALEAELTDLANRAMDSAAAQTLTLGVFRARTDGLNARVFGSAVWVQPAGPAAFAGEIDQYVAMLIELASAAIVQCRKDAALSGRASADRAGGEGFDQPRRFGLV